MEAELGRGNTVLHHGEWSLISNAYGRGETEYRLELRYALDTAAIEAEFELPSGIHLRNGSLIRDGASNAIITGGRAADAERDEAVRSWWERWQTGPRARITLSPVTSGDTVVPGAGPTDDVGRVAAVDLSRTRIRLPGQALSIVQPLRLG